MKVLKRDKNRCRICGRSPSDYEDVVLHVHHTRPWGKRGVTDINNLITLCHTCHNGLDPHEDQSLKTLLRQPENSDLFLAQGMARYRKMNLEYNIDDIANSN